jgi:hypothetical protein
MIEKFKESHPDFKYDINPTIIATTDGAYQPALDQALSAGGADAPDIYCAEAAFVLKYTQGDMASFACPYEDLGIDVSKEVADAKIAQYTVDIGTNPDGDVVALGYQATGGAFIYRRSIAKDVFGTDDPETVAAEIGAGSQIFDKFFEAAEKLKAKGYAIVSGDGDLWHAVENSSDQGWIVDGKLNIAPERQAFFDISKQLLDKGWSNETQDWTPAWYADMKGVSQEGKDNKPAFCFFGPAWLINYVMVGNSGGTKAGEGTYGDWRVCKAPAGFFWGGTWVLGSKSAAENADKKAGVAELIRWITLDSSDKGLQYMWANGTFNGEGGTKDCVASGKVMATADGKLDFLGGQNMFPAFIAANANATGKNMTQYDENINALFREQVNQYAHGQKDMEKAIADFKSNVADKIGADGEL